MSRRKAGSRKGPAVSRRDFLRTGTAGAVGAGLLRTELLRADEGQAEGKVLGPGPVPMTFRINSKKYEARLEPRVTLLDALRNHLSLTGAKKVCDRATCGACTVIIGGRAVYSCTTLAIESQGVEIQTIEGLGTPEKLHPLQAAFVEQDAQQCGFCTPGFVMACKAFLDQNPHPTAEQIRKGLGGNLCRCGTYAGILPAVLEAAQSGGKQDG